MEVNLPNLHVYSELHTGTEQLRPPGANHPSPEEEAEHFHLEPTVSTADWTTKPMSFPELQSRVESNWVTVQDANARLSLTEDKVAALEKKDNGVRAELNLFWLVALLLYCATTICS